MTKRAGKKKNRSPNASPQAQTTTDTKGGSQTERTEAKVQTTVDSQSAFWPELRPKRGRPRADEIEDRIKSKRMAEVRLELRAVRSGWPVPQAMRERIMYESFMMATADGMDPKLKQAAMKLIVLADKQNTPSNPSGLPSQIEVNVNNTVSSASASSSGNSASGSMVETEVVVSEIVRPRLPVQELIHEFLKDKNGLAAIDFRPIQDGEDYAD